MAITAPVFTVMYRNCDRGGHPRFLEFEEGESAKTVSQRDITQMVDIASATKYFELILPKFGPYRVDYTRNGRQLLLGGHMGHLAVIDWFSKELAFEINVMESIRDVQWLHNEMLMAVAQKRWTHVYDSRGTEVHVIKQLHNVLRLEFLPYHFLLVASNAKSFLSWVDVSIGKVIKSTYVRKNRLDVMCQNPANAIIHCGHPRGTVSLWSPNSEQPLVSMLCHSTAVRGLAVDPTGTYMATSGMEKQLKIWDLRMYKQVQGIKVPVPVNCLAFSQRKVLAAGSGGYVKVYRDVCSSLRSFPYLSHNCREIVTDVRFCPFEDVLGVGHRGGFASLLVPGAGEPNVDAFEANPHQSSAQRREAEVRLLLDKIQPEMIMLDSEIVGKVDREGLLAKTGVSAETVIHFQFIICKFLVIFLLFRVSNLDE
ncbi:unnamed protein product [Soboliphyme baturini]|uniref:WD_REPEATS_REGION domain-containing protein n=1 Tax=Soboliphyme baturini TaxID=241478 RepID=A0A183J3D7_9BILA|nr:unnamed protein product [Soboliphyme baturini]